MDCDFEWMYGFSEMNSFTSKIELSISSKTPEKGVYKQGNFR